ncbi:MAG TPA: VPLPA-CTERM sorting domain-containing protein [Methylibium sp.]|nr:VPLPA-CTERM sorting domain-containing protein [Methylibium sp.]
MKLNLKAIAAVAALVATTGAHADFLSGATGNSSVGVLAWNTTTNSYYLRNLGYTLNTFLPTNGAPLTGTGEAGATFDKTPEAGLLLDSASNVNFGTDANFSSWISAQSASDVRWVFFAGDSQGTTTNVNTARTIVSINESGSFVQPSVGSISNGAIAINGYGSTFAGISATGTLSTAQALSANGSFINQAGLTTALDGTANLFYFSRINAGTGSSAPGQNLQFGNSLHYAQLTLESDGDFVYSLAAADAPSAVPVPAAAWLMGSGLMAMAGIARRRKAAKQG